MNPVKNKNGLLQNAGRIAALRNLKTRLFTVLALVLCMTEVYAEDKKTGKALETGFERKLDVIYKTVGEEKLELDLYYPPATASKPCPVIVYTHGGGWAFGSRFGAASGGFALLFKDLTKKGFCIASVDYRLAKKDKQVRMRDCVIDSKDAIRFLVKNSESLNIDPKQVYVFGDSAGGHIAQMLLLSPPESLTGDADLAGVGYNVVAGCSWYGPCDFENQNLFNHDDNPRFRDRFGGRILGEAQVNEEEKLRLYREMSPIQYLKKDSPPMLMIQGDKDTTIPVKHAYRMQEALKTISAPVEILIVKNAGHNWREVDNKIVPTRDEITARTSEFFVKQLAQKTEKK
jgi:acetyl esterase/lipase